MALTEEEAKKRIAGLCEGLPEDQQAKVAKAWRRYAAVTDQLVYAILTQEHGRIHDLVQEQERLLHDLQNAAMRLPSFSS